MARVIFSLTDAQAAALTALRNDDSLTCDVRVLASLLKRGLASGDVAAPTLTPLGIAAASLVERLAISAGTSGHGS